LFAYAVGPQCVKEESREAVKLRSSGHDFNPSLGDKVVIFCRRDPEDVFRSSVYSVDLESKTEKLIFAGPVMYQGSRIEDLSAPEIDPTTNTLYLLVNDHVTTGQLFRVDLRTNKAN
jgi:hypothetical protein